MRLAALAVLALALCPVPAQAAGLHEADYQAVWCKAAGGVTEYVLDDKARVDCLTDDFAVEFDFDKKWAESIGQALYYGMETGRVPGVVIILGDEDDPSVRRHKARVEKLAERYAVALFYMRRADSIEALRAVYEGFVEFDHMIHQAYERLMLRKRTGDKIYWGEPE